MLVYVADDDKDICYMIERQLVKDGFEVMTFHDGLALYDQFQSIGCDLIITDVMMPAMTGFELCQKIRILSDVPIIIISANGEEEKKIRGYTLGSDDYLTKPFSLKALSMKARNMILRNERQKDAVRVDPVSTHDNEAVNLYQIKDVTIDLLSHSVGVNGKPMSVSEKEFSFLLLLVKNRNKALSREMIMEDLWGYENVEDTRLLDHVVKRIRKKLMEMDAEAMIETVWGYGYKVSDV